MTEKPDKDSKTEEASEKKIRDALEKGNMPVSREVSTFASLLAMLLAVGLLAGHSTVNLVNALRPFLDNPAGWTVATGTDAANLMLLLTWLSMETIAPAVLLLMAAGFAASALQNPPQLIFTRIKPDPSRLSLGKGWERLAGAAGRAEFLKSLFKFFAITVAGVLFVRASQDDMINVILAEPAALPETFHRLVMRLLGWVTGLTVLLVAADIVWTRIFWRQELRMTRQEVKEEHKQIDGDPLVKARLRSIARDRARKRMFAAVPRATMVIVNPTHYAVALRYVREEGGAPLVIAKGRDHVALRIRAVAEEHSLPIIEDKPLARSLHDAVAVDSMIPAQFYKAVAEIIHHLNTRGGKR